MTDRGQLIENLDRAREAMRAVVAEVDPGMEIYTGWTIKQVLAHITGWDDASIASLQAHVAGDAPATPAARGINYYNTQTVETRQELGLDHVIREWEYSREQFKRIILEMPQEKFDQPLVTAWGATGSVQELVYIFVEHEEEHANEILEIITGRR